MKDGSIETEVALHLHLASIVRHLQAYVWVGLGQGENANNVG